MQQSHSSSPQSHPKHGFDTVLMGFLMLDPELDEGSVKLTGDDETDEENAILVLLVLALLLFCDLHGIYAMLQVST